MHWTGTLLPPASWGDGSCSPTLWRHQRWGGCTRETGMTGGGEKYAPNGSSEGLSLGTLSRGVIPALSMTLHSPTRSRRSPLCCAPEAGGGAEQSLPLPAWEEKVPDPLRGGFQDGGAAEVLRAGLREPMRSGRLGGLQTRRRLLERGS